MSDPNSGIYNTVLSYIPGTQQYTESSDHHVKNSSSASEERHEVQEGASGGMRTGNTSGVGNTGAGNTSGVGNTGAGNTGYGSAYGNRAGDYDSQNALGGSGYETAGKTYGSEGHTFPSGERTSGGGLGLGNTSGSGGQTQGSGGRAAQDTPSHLHSGHNTGTGSKAPGSDVNYGNNTYGSGGYNTSEPASAHRNPGSDVNYGRNTGGSDNYNTSQPGSGYNNQAIGGSDGYNTSGPASGHKNQVLYEEDLADDTGTHHSGYKPDGLSSQGTQTGHQQHGDGVRGAPIEGENVKGYAIGAPVGSGDTEKPNHPGDPSGQVSGAHMEYLPQETDTRDSTGRGTVGKSQGTGDSSFANVKTKDNNGNSSHVISQSSTSHMSHSSVTQL